MFSYLYINSLASPPPYNRLLYDKQQVRTNADLLFVFLPYYDPINRDLRNVFASRLENNIFFNNKRKY